MLRPFATLPRLQVLHLTDNQLDGIRIGEGDDDDASARPPPPPPAGDDAGPPAAAPSFANLVHVSLSGNAISTWAAVDALRSIGGAAAGAAGCRRAPLAIQPSAAQCCDRTVTRRWSEAIF